MDFWAKLVLLFTAIIALMAVSANILKDKLREESEDK